MALPATNASPAMAPWGGREKRLGTNPWSIAAPGGRYGTVVMDIANTAVARGKIYAAEERGEPIPAGWAADADGAPTTDPRRAIEGLILPTTGHKGSAISFMFEVLAGVLTGSAFGSGAVGDGPQRRRPPADLRRHPVDGRPGGVRGADRGPDRGDEVHSHRPGRGGGVRPGRAGGRTAERLRTEGITLADDTWTALTRIAADTAVPLPAARTVPSSRSSPAAVTPSSRPSRRTPNAPSPTSPAAASSTSSATWTTTTTSSSTRSTTTRPPSTPTAPHPTTRSGGRRPRSTSCPAPRSTHSPAAGSTTPDRSRPHVPPPPHRPGAAHPPRRGRPLRPRRRRGHRPLPYVGRWNSDRATVTTGRATWVPAGVDRGGAPTT